MIQEAHVYVVGKRPRTTFYAALYRGDMWEFTPEISVEEANHLIQQMYQARYRYDSSVEVLHNCWVWRRLLCEACHNPVGIDGPVWVWNYAYYPPKYATVCEKCADSGKWELVY